MAEILLQTNDLHVSFGGIQALSGVSIALDEGEIVALMGPNGAGKSTVIKSIFGLVPIEQGSILWHEQELTPLPHEMVERGLSYVPQGRQIFPSLSVRENIVVGGHTLRSTSLKNSRYQDVLHLFPELTNMQDKTAGVLSGGQQQMLVLARGLMTDPKVLLLDEPTLGLSPKLVRQVFEKIREINEQRNTAVLVVEHNIKSLLNVAHRAYVLDHGTVVLEGTADYVRNSDIIRTVFTKAS
jgi:ABC-type branched-subunit amino acid transport system ATPase component